MGDLAHIWENSSVIRSRFRKSWSWLQWPYYAVDALQQETDDNDGRVEKHPVCTKSLELNVDTLIGVLDWARGGFVDIPALQPEARFEIYIHDLPLFWGILVWFYWLSFFDYKYIYLYIDVADQQFTSNIPTQSHAIFSRR